MRSLRLLFVVVAVGIAACASAASQIHSNAPVETSPSPFVDVPFDSRGPVPSGCYEVHSTPSQDPPSIEHLSGIADTILLGTFDGHDQARWNTLDGHRPTRSELIETSARLHRPLRITVERAIRGDRDDAAHAFDPGGRLDCDLTALAGGRELAVGGRYCFFLIAVTNSVGDMVGDLQLIDAWPVDGDDVVETVSEGPMPLADLIEAIEPTPEP